LFYGTTKNGITDYLISNKIDLNHHVLFLNLHKIPKFILHATGNLSEYNGLKITKDVIDEEKYFKFLDYFKDIQVIGFLRNKDENNNWKNIFDKYNNTGDAFSLSGTCQDFVRYASFNLTNNGTYYYLMNLIKFDTSIFKWVVLLAIYIINKIQNHFIINNIDNIFISYLNYEKLEINNYLFRTFKEQNDFDILNIILLLLKIPFGIFLNYNLLKYNITLTPIYCLFSLTFKIINVYNILNIM